MSATTAALAEAVATAPPEDLRERTLARALDRRPAGRPVDAGPPCTSTESFTRTIADFEALLRSLTAAEWDAPAHDEHGAVRDLVAHLIGIERISARWLRDEPDLPPLPDHVAATRETVADLRDRDPDDLVTAWCDAVQDVLAAARSGDPARPVQWHDITLTVDRYFNTRSFELWAHGMDIALATGRPVPAMDDERMALLSGRLMAVLPFALAYRGSPLPGRTARFVLTGPAGGAYTVPLAPGEEPGAARLPRRGRCRRRLPDRRAAAASGRSRGDDRGRPRSCRARARRDRRVRARLDAIRRAGGAAASATAGRTAGR